MDELWSDAWLFGLILKAVVIWRLILSKIKDLQNIPLF